MILIQVKGGSAEEPTADDAERMRRVAEHYSARDVLLATWKRGSELNMRRLDRKSGAWEHLDNPRKVFK